MDNVTNSDEIMVFTGFLTEAMPNLPDNIKIVIELTDKEYNDFLDDSIHHEETKEKFKTIARFDYNTMYMTVTLINKDKDSVKQPVEEIKSEGKGITNGWYDKGCPFCGKCCGCSCR